MIKIKILIYSFVTIFFCTTVFVSPVESTSIISIRTAKDIFIGADSFVGDISEYQVGTDCKIRQAGNVFFAISGKPIVKVEGGNLDIFKIAKDIFSRNIPIQERITTYDLIVKWNLIKIIDAIRHKSDIFNLFKRGDSIAVSITIVMKGDMFPVAYHIDHNVISSSEEPAMIKSVIINSTERLNSTMDTIISDNDKKVCYPMMKDGTDDPTKIIRECIELISKTNPRVKLPIDILRITQTGAEWIQRKPECPEINQSFF
ncbi:MAG: hypothetical protein WA126_01995 [Thermodesulfovibrionales bacterium]